MTMSKSRAAKIEELRKRLEEEERAQKAEEREEQRHVRRAKKVAGDNHTRLTLALYDLLDIRPEHPKTRVVDGQTTSVAVDKDEAVRTQRLLTFIEGLVDKAGSDAVKDLKRADRQGRDERKPAAKIDKQSTSKKDESAEHKVGGADSANEAKAGQETPRPSQPVAPASQGQSATNAESQRHLRPTG